MSDPTHDEVIRLESLTKTYGSITAVDDLSLAVNRGEIFGFLGPNGAGKTTTINMLCGIMKPDKGNIFFNFEGNSFSKTDHVALFDKRFVGVCPQETILWELLSCREQLVFAAELYGVQRKRAKENAQRLLEQIGLTDKADKLAKTLSGGMQRRLNIAMALVHDPRVVIFDEPEAGLDPQSRVLMRDFLRSLAPEKTVIFTSHNMDEVERICHRVAIIDHGKLLVLDSVQALKESAGEGDIIELTLPDPVNEKDIESKLRAVTNHKLKYVTQVDGRLVIRVKDAAHQLAGILDVLSDNRIVYSDIAFRWNSLEDVFINLTGRSLRQ